MTDIIKNLAAADASRIQLADPIKRGGWYVAHASINGKPIIYQLHPLLLRTVSDDLVVFDLGESNQLSSHIVQVDKRLMANTHERSTAFFGRPVRADTIENAYTSNAHDGTWSFPLDPDMTVKDQYGNSHSVDSLQIDEDVTVFVELVGVSIGKVTIKPSWKLHKIQVYKKTKLDDSAVTAETPEQQDAAATGQDDGEEGPEVPSFYPDAVES